MTVTAEPGPSLWVTSAIENLSNVSNNSQPTDLERSVEPSKNVLPFRPLGEPKPPVLTPVENSAFNELARQLSGATR